MTTSYSPSEGAAGDAVGAPEMVATAVARALAGVTDFGDLVRQIAVCLGLDKRPRAAVRLWLLRGEEPEPLVAHPPGGELPRVPTVTVRRAVDEGALTAGGATFLALVGGGDALGVLEVRTSRSSDRALAPQVAAVAGARLEALLAAQRQRELLPNVPLADDAQEIQEVISAFAAQAKRLLEHDRLSIYLLTPDGLALERFGVATSPIVPGEGEVLPLEQVGLTRVVKLNEPIVSHDFGVDERIRGLEDSIIARAGFHGLVSVPLRVGGKPFGLLNFVSKTPGFYSEADIGVAQQIADEVAVFLQNLRLQYAIRGAVEREAVTRERNRVAREFHDTLAQTLSSLAARAGALNEEPALPARGPVRSHAAALLELSENALDEVRRALQDMLPSQLQERPLAEAIEQELSQLQREEGIATSFAASGDLTELPRGTQIAVYRIFSEAINNVRRHAEASSVGVQLRVDGEELQLSIKDNGKGLRGDHAVEPFDGFGLETMRERAQALGGRVVVSSTAGSGTDVFLHLPHAVSGELSVRPRVPTSAAPSVLRVVVVDDHPTFREGVRQALESDRDIRVVGEAGSGSEGLGEVRSKRPDVVLLDLNLPDASGIALTEEITQVSPATVVVMMSAFAEEANVGEALRAGAKGYVAKSSSPAALLDAIRTAAAGGTVVTPAVAQESTVPGETLTAREIEILKHLALGKTNAEIGHELHLADKTIERVVATIASKLRAKNRAHAVAKGVARKLIDVRDA